MSKTRDPPTMSEFPEIYVLALNKLQTKINDEDASIRVFEQNTSHLNDLLNNGGSNRSIKNERQFVFKVNVVEGIYSQNPIFQLNVDTNDSAELPFSDFEDGDAMITLPLAANNINITVLKENREPVYAWNIDLSEFGDKRRQMKHTSGRYNNQDVVIEYEGQIIFSQNDYHRGLLYINSQKIEDSKQNKFDFTRMRDDLLNLFKDQNLRASVLGAAQPGRGSLTTSQYDMSGPTPVLRNSQIGGNFINKQLQPTDSLIGGTNVSGGLSAKPAGLVAANPGLSTTRQPLTYTPDPITVRTQPNELGVYSGGFSSVKQQFQNATGNIMPKAKLSWSWWVHLLFYINLALLVVSFFVNWNRASFLSILMAIVFTTWYLLREDYETLLPAVFLFVGYLIAFALDLTWLIMVSRNLWNNSLYVHDGSLAGLDKFMIIMSYIIIFLEVAAMVICGILFQRGMFTNASDAAQLSTVPLKF